MRPSGTRLRCTPQAFSYVSVKMTSPASDGAVFPILTDCGVVRSNLCRTVVVRRLSSSALNKHLFQTLTSQLTSIPEHVGLDAVKR